LNIHQHSVFLIHPVAARHFSQDNVKFCIPNSTLEEASFQVQDWESCHMMESEGRQRVFAWTKGSPEEKISL
jgi:hypothetical protein